ncbi:5-hydroxymethyl-dUMP N-hydrolase-like [Halichoeres trimaculatus]|uniref:5-hydroxymethyl-dUMP N-hydrolase-like n=1 Tax=Halichoeres trimaculatus TaxID=147232 RepID=UPI003D9EE324
MKIYFSASIRGGRDDVDLYQRIVKKLKSYGTVLTEDVSSSELTERDENALKRGDKAIHDQDMNFLRQSDMVVAEVTQPSLGVGYELGRALDMKKKVFCLFRPSSGRNLSAMIRGADDGNLFVVRNYSEDELESILEDFFNKLRT